MPLNLHSSNEHSWHFTDQHDNAQHTAFINRQAHMSCNVLLLLLLLLLSSINQSINQFIDVMKQ